MTWADTIVQALKDSDVSLVAYVPDISIHQVTKLMQDDPYFHVVSATREEEAIGIAVGSYAVGRNAAVFMQSSGFGNCVNAIASLCIPCRVPIPLFINMRGEVGEMNPWQYPMGQAVEPVLEAMGILTIRVERIEDLEDATQAASAAAFKGGQGVALILSQKFLGAKPF